LSQGQKTKKKLLLSHSVKNPHSFFSLDDVIGKDRHDQRKQQGLSERELRQAVISFAHDARRR